MTERGWGWTASRIRQIKLIEWVIEHSSELLPDEYLLVEPFYRGLPDQSENVAETARGDLRAIEAMWGFKAEGKRDRIETLGVRASDEARFFVEGLRAMREDKQQRRIACRDAMVDWLYAQDAVNPQEMALRDVMLADLTRGTWLGQPFTSADLAVAAGWLHRQKLVDGIITSMEAEGPEWLYLTGDGVKCAEHFGSDVSAFLTKVSSAGPTVTIGTHSGPLQVAGDHAHQQQSISISTEQLRLQITGITEIVRAFVPDAPDAMQAEQDALAAVKDNAVDIPALKRFRDWVLSTLRSGADAAAVAVVSSATTTLLIEAGRLASHLGLSIGLMVNVTKTAYGTDDGVSLDPRGRTRSGGSGRWVQGQPLTHC
jgi:hypothetical protein